MGFFKRLAGVFGFGQEAVKNEEDDDSGGGIYNSGDGDKLREDNQPRFPRKGFGVQVQVAVERSHLLQPCVAGDGGIQTNAEDDHNCIKTMPRLQIKGKTKPAKVRGLVVSSDGKLQQCIEHQGRLFIV